MGETSLDVAANGELGGGEEDAGDGEVDEGGQGDGGAHSDLVSDGERTDTSSYPVD